MTPSPKRCLVLTLFTASLAIATGAFAPKGLSSLPGGFERPVLALEFVSTLDDFKIAEQTVAGQPVSPMFFRATMADFAFIAAYGLLWATMLRSGPSPLVRRVGVAAVVVAVGADVVENAAILRGLADVAAAPVSVIRAAAIVKWAALAAAFIALLWTFWPDKQVRDGWQLWGGVLGLAYGYAGLLIAIGLIWHPPLIERSALPVAVALLMQIPKYWHELRVQKKR